MAQKSSMALKEIHVGNRFRKDMGDIDGLAASMSDVGLLQPVAVWPDGKLACGRRRLLAAKKLGWESIPVLVLETADDLVQQLKVERDENTCRKDFLPTEALAVGKAIEERLAKEAKERQAAAGPREGRGKKTGSGNFPEPVNGKAGQTRDKVGESVGMSGKTYEKAKKVEEAAKTDPKNFGDLPDRMDRKSVDAAYKEMKKRQTPIPPPPICPHSDMVIAWLKRVTDQTNYINVECGGIGGLLSEKNKWNWKDVKEYIIPMLEAVGETIAKYRNEIEAANVEHHKKSKVPS
jgi:ParB-like chromosome segregation protein Spo0J